jgi:hypothetical protein
MAALVFFARKAHPVIGSDDQKHIVLPAGLGQSPKRYVQSSHSLKITFQAQVMASAVNGPHIHKHEKMIAQKMFDDIGCRVQSPAVVTRIARDALRFSVTGKLVPPFLEE